MERMIAKIDELIEENSDLREEVYEKTRIIDDMKKLLTEIRGKRAEKERHHQSIYSKYISEHNRLDNVKTFMCEVVETGIDKYSAKEIVDGIEERLLLTEQKRLKEQNQPYYFSERTIKALESEIKE